MEFEKTVKFNYFGIGAGMATIAFQMDTNRESNMRTVKFGYALCSPKDNFSRGDIFKKVYSPLERDERGRPTNLGNRKYEKVLVHPGGRSLALTGKRGLYTNPVELQFSFKKDVENPVSVAIEEMQSYIFDHAPRWKNKTAIISRGNGHVSLYRDGFHLDFANPNFEELVCLTDRETKDTFVY